MTRPRLHGRDYKSAQRRGAGGPTRWRDVGLGLAVGLGIAIAVYVSDHRRDPAAADAKPEPRASTKKPASAPPEPEELAAQYDFYDMLPKFEVVVPEKGERDVRRDLPSARVERPGVYVLQAGSYRNPVDAERVRSQLGKQGINATVQRVAVDTDVWHRVRVGPVRDLAQVNRLRDALRAADIDALVIRIGD